MKRTSMVRKLSFGLVAALLINLLYGLTVVEAAGTFQVTLKQPLNGAKGVPVSTKQIQLEFGREVKMASGTIQVQNAADPTDIIATQNVAAQNFAISRYDIDLPSGSDLNYGTTYQIIGSAGTFVDANDSTLSSAAINLSFTTISEAGSTNPKIDPAPGSLSPAKGASVSGTSVTLSVTFDKPVYGGTGNIYIKRASTNQAVATLAVNQPGVTIAGKVATFTVNNLLAGERYYVLMDPGVFKDIDNQPFEGINSASEWYFNVLSSPVGWDSTTRTVPANNATGVPITGSIQLNFTRPVYPITGKIRLELSNSPGTLVKEYDVTSADVSGGGTSRISLVLPTLSYNTGYTVTVPTGVFEDSDHNVAAGYAWKFSTGTSTSTALTPSFSPADRSTNNAVTVTPVVTFNRSIKLNTPSGVRLYKQGSASWVDADVYVSSNNMQVIIKPKSNLQEASTYYVDIANGAISDLATGANYAGISGTTSWTFLTAAVDKTAPVLQSATMYSNSTIRMQYNETLDSSVSLLTSSFTVTVNGETRRLSSAYVSGDSIYVSLDTGVAVGQKVSISYSSNSVRPIRDLAGNAAVSFSGREVTNGVDSVLPKPKDGYVSGSTLVLNFSDTLKSVSSYAYQQFSVTADGYSKGINSITQGGSTVTLSLSSSVSNGEIVKVSYYPGSYPLQDYRGQDIPSFTDYFVRNYNDTKPPEFQGAEGSGNKIILTYNEALKTTSIPMKSQFSVLVNNSPVYVTNVEIVGSQVFLTLASSFTQTQAVTLSYVSGAGGIADLNGNLAGYINLQPVSYGAVTEGVRSATVRGDTVTVTYYKSLMPVSSLPINQFYVSVDQANRGIQSASLNGDTVTIKLSSPVTSGQTVKLTYVPGSAPLYDSSGALVKSYSDMPLQNLTGSDTTTNSGSGQPSYLTALPVSDFGKSGYVLGTSSAQISGGTSKRGQSINKYTVDRTRLQESFKYLTNTNVSNRMIVFEVPSTEKAAQVVAAIAPLRELYNSGKTGSFAVKYGDVLYEIPVEKIPYSDVSQSLMASSLDNVNLTIQLESIPRNQLPTPGYNPGLTLTSIVDPVQIDVSASNGVTSQGTSNVALRGQVQFRVQGQASAASQGSLVKYDTAAGTLSHVPSSVTGNGANLIFDGAISGNAIVGPALGYSYFADTIRHWAKSDIAGLANKLIIEPRSNAGSNFEPDKNITRAEFAVFIAKGLGLAGDEANARRFPDVSSGMTAAYIGAAAKAGIINGNADGTFKPNSNITREQMALMMVRAMEYAGYDTSMNGASTATLTKFKDAAKIQSKETVAKAVKEGIIQGVTTNTFQPQGNATRAQAAVMLKRVLDKLNYI
ncbi:SwmB domain-containing protein [uncultured Paenibacillus sp.]|uniref:SwmB domain-containing protein n=1 Tax=uncultured Paenibacillus sp. TaxID=227322 RepID=UPI0028054C39|nr:SwmB domain-containing protein [uncultured Paenibacillus sp.]